MATDLPIGPPVNPPDARTRPNGRQTHKPNRLPLIFPPALWDAIIDRSSDRCETPNEYVVAMLREAMKLPEED